ncbi:MAG: hypothetical protein WCV71_02355 [Patescibacteria group bacterium]|jgi:hypothetical protein
MKKSKFYLLSGFLGLVLTTLVVSSMASAGETTGKWQGKNFDSARYEAMEESRQALQTALDNGDYNAWKEIVDSRPKITDYVNQDNFVQFVQMHKDMQAGDFEAADTIRTELGIPMGLGMGEGPHRGGHMGRGGMGRQALQTEE